MQYIFRDGAVLEYSYSDKIKLDEYQLKAGEHWVTSKEEPKHHFVVNENGSITKGLGGWRPLEQDFPNIVEIASTSDNATDFHASMWMEYGDKSPVTKANREKLWKQYKGKQKEWRTTVGKVDDYLKLQPELKKFSPNVSVEELGKGTVMGQMGNTIIINPKYLNSEQNLKQDFYHEIGHAIQSNLNIDDDIRKNYGDVWGRYNNKKKLFDGITGRTEGVHESFADIFSYYIMNPQWCQKTFPDAYKVMKHILSSVDYKTVINAYEQELKKMGVKL